MVSQDPTTWDGQPIAREHPTGAAVVVYRRTSRGTEFLLLHRAHHGAEYEGDWAWTPPSGARHPGEAVEACAARELLEEAGIAATPTRLEGGPQDWAIFALEVAEDVQIDLRDTEHDRYEWVPLSVAVQRCLPERVTRGLRWAAECVGA